MTVLLVDVPEIEVKVSHGSQTAVAKGGDFLNDRRANPLISNLSLTVSVATNQSMLFPEPAIRGGCQRPSRWKGQENVRFPWSHKNEALDFHSVKILPRKNHSDVLL